MLVHCEYRRVYATSRLRSSKRRWRLVSVPRTRFTEKERPIVMTALFGGGNHTQANQSASVPLDLKSFASKDLRSIVSKQFRGMAAIISRPSGLAHAVI